jgi:RNA polymerase sigma-32 factor
MQPMNVKLDSTLTRFVEEAKRYPMLTPEREREIATAWRNRDDRAALDELVGSHLRLVVKIARGFVGYGLPLADLVAEGNIGLMQAAEKFEPERGFRFATYAMWWIRAAIQEYILHSWSLVKIGTTAAQKKLFFNLRRLKAQLEEFEQGDLARETVAAIAKDLNVAEGEVVEMNRRLGGVDNSLNAMLGGDADSEWLELLPDERPTQETVVGDLEEGRRRRTLLGAALKKLNPREREIVVERRLKDEPATLEELSHRYAVSRERIRQIEVRAVEKLQKAVTANSSRPVEQIAA